jgi:hypothetical protein
MEIRPKGAEFFHMVRKGRTDLMKVMAPFAVLPTRLKLQYKRSVNVPKLPENCFNRLFYCKEGGVFCETVTVFFK